MKTTLLISSIAILLFGLACEKENNTAPISDGQEPVDRVLISHDQLFTIFSPSGLVISEFSCPGFLFDVNQQTGDIWITNQSDDSLHVVSLDGTLQQTIPIKDANYPCINQSTGDCWLIGRIGGDWHYFCVNSDGQIIRELPSDAGHLIGVYCDEVRNQIWGAEFLDVVKFTTEGEQQFIIPGGYYQPVSMCVVQSDGSCWIGWINLLSQPLDGFLAHYSQNGYELANINSFGGALDVMQDDGSVICGDEHSRHLVKYDAAGNLVWSLIWVYGHIISVDVNQQNGDAWVLTHTDAVRISPNGEVQMMLTNFGQAYCLRLYEPAQSG